MEKVTARIEKIANFLQAADLVTELDSSLTPEELEELEKFLRSVIKGLFFTSTQNQEKYLLQIITGLTVLDAHKKMFSIHFLPPVAPLAVIALLPQLLDGSEPAVLEPGIVQFKRFLS